MKALKRFVRCLFCNTSLGRLVAKKHNCPEKLEVEKRLGTKLATYDPLDF